MKYQTDYYKALGVSETASPEEIKKVYRKLAIQYHPDKNKGNKQAEDRFKEISEAYYVLSNPQKRAEFDQYRKYGGRGAHPSGGFHGADGFNFEDLLRSYGGQGRGRASRAQSYSGFTDIFEELFSGRSSSQGSSSPFNMFSGAQSHTPTPSYDSESVLKISKEQSAKGGLVKIRSKGGKTIQVKIPSNAEDGMKLRLAALGKSKPDGTRGNLILTIKVVA